ncbi:DNA polymerase I [Helicobacter saguini]|uniref:DNA polymerase I n=2 Tax=Helicobacter saguini TaxID=1548018 RepID=A0A4U8T8I7_9HELI|nr:DNA polymerase I [Helicobacter saguini]TLD95989.1 DNA polymerase I [Helicobacter saguini]
MLRFEMQVILIDTFGFFFRSFYALPPLFNSKGFPTSLLTGFANLIFEIFKKNKGCCIIFTLEGHDNKRKEIYKDYKANRSEAPADLLLQLPVAVEWLQKMGLKTLQINGYEADDCIATLSHLAQAQGFQVRIISHDKDLYQLINENVIIYDYGKKRVITAAECVEKFGVSPRDFITYQSIVGDSSDNIPGIKGIGAKGAVKILEHFKSLESLYDSITADTSNVESLLGKRAVALILASKDNAFLSRELVTLNSHLLENYDFLESKNEFENSPLLKIAPELKELEMQKILSTIGADRLQLESPPPLRRGVGGWVKNPDNPKHQTTQIDSIESHNTNSITYNTHNKPTPQPPSAREGGYKEPNDKGGGLSTPHDYIESNAQDFIESKSQNIKEDSKDFIESNLGNLQDSKKDSNVSQNLDSKKDSNKFTFKAHLINDKDKLFTLLDSIPKDTTIAFDCETTGLDYRSEKMVGFSFCFDGFNGYYVPFLHKPPISNYNELSKKEIESIILNSKIDSVKQISIADAKLALQQIFTHPLIAHNIKFDIQVALHNFGIYPQNDIKDSMILAWLLNPGSKIGLKELLYKYFKYETEDFDKLMEKIYPKKKLTQKPTFDFVSLEQAKDYGALDSIAAYVLYHKLESMLGIDLKQELKNIETPLIPILINMENNGICVDRQYFIKLKPKFEIMLNALANKIHTQSGYHGLNKSKFNVNSPKQVSEVLFNELKLSTKGNPKKSTNEIYLEAIISEHPVVETLLEYREVFKLFSSYIEPILRLTKGAENAENKGLFNTLDSKDSIESKNRIYTQFLQTGTATGRLSSKSPNLQNISVRSDLGKSIRAGFIARSGYVLASLDYSQIELRLLAHFSGDKTLISAFHNNADIHAQTAKMIFGENIESSGDFATFRNIAKSINFGLIYGMGARKLAQTLQITQFKAKEYIDKYFAKLPHIRDFLESKRVEIENLGYAETLFKRRRYFDFSIANEGVRQGFLREGVNTIFQGSAADLIKKSMIEICDTFGLSLQDSTNSKNIESKGLFSNIDSIESKSQMPAHHPFNKTDSIESKGLFSNIDSKDFIESNSLNSKDSKEILSPIHHPICKDQMPTHHPFKSENSDYKIKLLLQVHDELIFEIKQDLAQNYTQKIKQIMESTYKLKVPLICNIAIASNWAALK